MQEPRFQILAGRCCHTATCLTIMQAENSDLVVVGDAHALISDAALRARVGQGEAAVVIPRSLLMDALQALNGQSEPV